MTSTSDVIVLSDSDGAEEAQSNGSEHSGSSKIRTTHTNETVTTPAVNNIQQRSPSSNECALAIAKLNLSRLMSGLNGNMIPASKTASTSGNASTTTAPAGTFEKPNETTPIGFRMKKGIDEENRHRMSAKLPAEGEGLNSSEIGKHTFQFFLCFTNILITKP